MFRPRRSRGCMKYLRDQVLRAAEKKVGRTPQGLREPRRIWSRTRRSSASTSRTSWPSSGPTTRLEAAYDPGSSSRPSTRIPDLKVKLLSQINGQRHQGRLVPDQHVVHPDPRAEREGGARRPDHRLPFLQSAGRPEARRAHPRPTRPLPELAEFAAQFAKKLRKTVVPRTTSPASSATATSCGTPSTASPRSSGWPRSIGFAGRRLHGQQGQPGLPHPADGHLPAHRLRGPRRLPVHPAAS